ncbi:MAG: GTP cyclohydrolase I FolE [Anaerolineae bacterium]|nr:GTP cyclohydrolase I FolE [Anaerolineae bacterium]
MVDLGRRHIPDPAIYHDPHVALPLADLAPDWVHPESGETLAEIAHQLNFSDKEIYKVNILPPITHVPAVPNGNGRHIAVNGLPEPYDPHFEGLVRQILTRLGEDSERDGLKRTPLRVARALDFLTAGYRLELQEVINGALFDVEDERGEMVIVKDIEFYSLCEHHLLPFFGKAHIGYLPNGKIIGLSKMARVVDVFARRLQVQERLTGQVADALMEVLDARGVAVVLEASHFCMMMRGVQKQHSSTVTSAMRGVFQSDPGKREEFARLRQR